MMVAGSAPAGEPVHHDLRVTLHPDAGRIEVEDRLDLPADVPRELELSLHAGFEPATPTPGVELERRGTHHRGVPSTRYRVTLPGGRRAFTLRYSGRIVNPPVTGPRGRQSTPGHLSSEGVYLDPGSRWYPRLGARNVTFTLRVSRPPDWRTISQGAALGQAEGDGWREDRPQRGIYLAGGPLHAYERATPAAHAAAYLRAPEPELAERYLEATARHLTFYSRLIGDYPYAKFAAVENFFESGFGLPSFTLLGPRVIRLPFIVETSYPHELVHNWWGNGVYIDPDGGNWSEGLTTYLADHLLAERRAEGAAFRRQLLRKYADYVDEHREVPLARFRARHGEASQAIGYSKGAMLFHMLRRRLGDETFLEGLRRFYEAHRFRRAGFDDLQQTFEAVSGRALGTFFDQWLQRPGAPRLELVRARAQRAGAGYRLRAVVRQRQRRGHYEIRVPVAVWTEDGDAPIEATLEMSDNRHLLERTLAARPLRIAVDPRFDVFRRLDPRELPPAFGALYGARRAVFVLPGAAPASVRAAYRELAEAWASDDDRIVTDATLETLPDDRAVWLLGWDNRFRGQLARSLETAPFALDAESVRIDGARYTPDAHTVAVSARRGRRPLAWVAVASAQAVPAVARKLPHYDGESYVVFRGAPPRRVTRGRWPVTDSPLVIELAPRERAVPALPPRRALGATTSDATRAR